MTVDLDALERLAALGITLPDKEQRLAAGVAFANALLDAFPALLTEVRALRRLYEADRAYWASEGDCDAWLAIQDALDVLGALRREGHSR